MALWGLASLGRSRVRTLPSCLRVISRFTAWVKVPFGPFTVTVLSSSTVTVTPAGTVIGSFPIRDIVLHLHCVSVYQM